MTGPLKFVRIPPEGQGRVEKTVSSNFTLAKPIFKDITKPSLKPHLREWLFRKWDCQQLAYGY